MTNNTNTNSITFREARNFDERRKLEGLQKEVYADSRLSGFTHNNSTTSVNSYKLFGLFHQTRADGIPEERPVGAVRVVDISDPENETPLHGYWPESESLDGGLLSLRVKNRKTVTLCGLSLDRSARSVKMARTFVACTIAAVKSTGVTAALFTVNRSQVRFYESFGFAQVTGSSSVIIHGNELTLVSGPDLSKAPHIEAIVDVFAKQFADSGKISFSLPPARVLAQPQIQAQMPRKERTALRKVA